MIDASVLRDARLQLETAARRLNQAEKLIRYAKGAEMGDQHLEKIIKPIVSEAKSLLHAAEARLP
jgi:hypothetical protein